jgi:hypothetical protein
MKDPLKHLWGRLDIQFNDQLYDQLIGDHDLWRQLLESRFNLCSHFAESYNHLRDHINLRLNDET